MFFSATTPGFGRRPTFLATGRQLERALDQVAQRTWGVDHREGPRHDGPLPNAEGIRHRQVITQQAG